MEYPPTKQKTATTQYRRRVLIASKEYLPTKQKNGEQLPVRYNFRLDLDRLIRFRYDTSFIANETILDD
jgi:hypothetical protein